MTEVGIYGEMKPEPSRNPSGSALGISLVPRLYFTVYPSSCHNKNTVVAHLLQYHWLQSVVFAYVPTLWAVELFGNTLAVIFVCLFNLFLVSFTPLYNFITCLPRFVVFANSCLLISVVQGYSSPVTAMVWDSSSDI